jgi:SSS family solute:Na+ symporter
MFQAWGPFVLTVSYTLVSIILGCSAKGKLNMKQVENWSRSGNTLGLVVMVFLTGAGNISAYTFLGAPGWSFSRGVAAFYVVVYLAFMLYTSYLVSPRIAVLAKKENLGTSAEAIGVRFESQGLRILCGVVGAIGTVGLSLVQIIGCGYILNIMSNNVVPLWLGELIIVIAIAIYVFTSGLRAIGWTNVMQGILMFSVSCLVGVFVIVTVIGRFSPGEVFKTLAASFPESLTLPGKAGNFPPSLWTTSILISIFTVWPQYWIMAAGGKSVDVVRKQHIYVPIFYFVMIPMIIVGFTCVFAFPEYTGPSDQVALSFIYKNLPWWLVGLVGAGILAASQSSAEPMFHTAAYGLSHDVVVPLTKIDNVKEGRLQRYILLIVMFAIALPLAIKNPAELIYIYLVAYGFVGQLFPGFLGIFVWPRATKAGILAGVISGVVLVALFNFVWPNPLNVHAGIWGLLLNIPVFIIVSLFTKPAKKATLSRFFPDYIMDQLYE